MSIKVTNEVPTYDTPANTSVKVLSNWCMHDRVVIKINDESRVVIGRDIIAAIENAMNKGTP